MRITAFERPYLFVDELERGAFKTLRHVHTFSPHGGGTLMIDVFQFESPYGVLGWIVDRLVLAGYIRAFLIRRNWYLKAVAEGDRICR